MPRAAAPACPLLLAAVLAIAAPAVRAADPVPAAPEHAAQLQVLLAHFRSRGVELRPAKPGPANSYIQYRYTVGPDHGRKHVVGLSYLQPPARDADMYSLPHAFHGGWALFMVGGPRGNATPEYEADWARALAAFRSYPAAAPSPR